MASHEGPGASTKREYVPANFFLLRANTFSVDSYVRILAERQEGDAGRSEDRSETHALEDPLEALAAEPAFMTALEVASPQLTRAISDHGLGMAPDKRSRKRRASALRYLARATSRPTPFGLFAGVALGELGDSTRAQLGQPIIERTLVRPDGYWMLTWLRETLRTRGLAPEGVHTALQADVLPRVIPPPFGRTSREDSIIPP